MEEIFDYKDYLEEARGRVTEQFIGAPVFDKYLQLLIDDSLELQSVLKDLLEKRGLDTATGVNLDIIGNIVGQPRVLIDADLLTFFGFQGEWHSDSYGTIHDTSVGSVWWDGKATMTGNITLNDDLYRLLIKAKIAKNVTNATPEDIMRFANFIFNTSGSTIVSEGGAKFTILIGKVLTRQEVGLLRYINRHASYESRLFPKPIGVGIGYGSFDYDRFFGFQGVPNAKGYGSLEFTMHYDGQYNFDGPTPDTVLARDEEGNLIGGYWATLHEDL